MSAKVKLPHGVIKAIEHLRSIGWSDYSIIVSTKSDGNLMPEITNIKDWLDRNSRCLDPEEEKGTTKLLHALVNGYELENPNARILQYYLNLRKMPLNSMSAQSADTIEIVLEMLGIEIEGINKSGEAETT